jgi:hypothetical protein
MHRVVMILGVGRIDGDERQSRQSSRPFSVAGCASSASRTRRGEKACGISWAWIAIRLIAFLARSEPSRSFTLPEARP